MNRNSKFAFFTLIIVGLFSSMSLSIFAQKAEISKIESQQQKCAGEKFVMPVSISVGNDAFANYLKAASLPVKERRTAFREFSNGQKASFSKFNLLCNLSSVQI